MFDFDSVINKKILVEIYTDKKNPDSFSLGFVKNISDKHMLLNSVTPDGEYDGYLILNILDIYDVKFDTDYAEKILKLYNLKNQKHRDLLDTQNPKDANLFYLVLNLAFKNKLFISVRLKSDKELSGRMLKIESDKLELESYDFFDGFISNEIVCINDISRLLCEDKESTNLQLIFS